MSEESSSKNKIHFDKKEISKKLNSYQKYQTNTATIIRWEDDINTDTEMYIMKNKINNLPFLGVIDCEFEINKVYIYINQNMKRIIKY